MYVSCLSWKCCIFIGFLILRKPHRWKKFVWLRTKIFSTNQIAVFFDHQYFCMESSNLLDILHGDSFIKDRWVPRLDLLVGSNHLCLSFNQIVGFCDYQYLWKESSDSLFFFAWSYSSRAFRTTTFGWVESVVSLIQWGRRLFDHQYLCKKSSDILFFAWR